MYLRLIDFAYHSTLGLRVITKRRRQLLKKERYRKRERERESERDTERLELFSNLLATRT